MRLLSMIPAVALAAATLLSSAAVGVAQEAALSADLERQPFEIRGVEVLDRTLQQPDGHRYLGHRASRVHGLAELYFTGVTGATLAPPGPGPERPPG